MKRWVFAHSDGDGLCAGSLALGANSKSEVFFSHPFGLAEDLRQVEDGDAVVICDIAISESHLPEIIERFRTIARKGDLVYIDHHPLPKTILADDIPGVFVHNSGSSTSELAYSYFDKYLKPRANRVAIYGAIADYSDNTPLIRRLLRQWDKRTIYFETGILVQGIEGHKRDYNFKRKIVLDMANNIPPSFNKGLVNDAIENAHREEEILRDLHSHIHKLEKIAYVLNIPFSLGKTAIYTRALAGTVVGIAGEERGIYIDMSLRTCESDVDLNRILREIAPKYGGSGGGHSMAAGSRIQSHRFGEFIEDLERALEEIRATCRD